MRVLVTGGAGFIGSHLVEALVREGHETVVLDNLATGKLANLAAVRAAIEWHEGDIRDPAALRAACRGAEAVFHLAALGSVPRSVAEPVLTHEINATGTLNVLMAAREAGAGRVIFSASSAAYGDSPALPKVESMPPAPLSPYAASKVAGELYLRSFHSSYGLATISLRYFNVFGPRQDPASEYAAVIPKFLAALSSGGTPVIHGDGEQTRDFIHVSDVVRANLLALAAPELRGEAVNIARGESTSLNQLLAAMGAIFGASPRPAYTPARIGDVRHSVAEIGLAKRLLGFEPRMGLEEGLRGTAAWFGCKPRQGQ